MYLAGARTFDGMHPMPRGDAALAHLARPVVTSARPLLAESRALLLSLTSSRDNGEPISMCWNGPSVPVSLPPLLALDNREIRAKFGAFASAGLMLLSELARRWPDYAVPPALGFVTDGSSVVFSPEHPSPLGQDWLLNHQSGCSVATILLPPSGPDIWALLTGPPANVQLH